MARGVLLWWYLLIATSIANVAGWAFAVLALRRVRTAMRKAHYEQHRLQLALAGVFVAVCAFRSFLPRADVQRICLVDSWASSVAVGRSLATVSELCFATQWALFMGALGAASGARVTRAISRVLVPLVVFAETASWYAVVTTSFLGNVIEQSTWTFCGVLIVVGVASARERIPFSARRYLHGALGVSVIFLTFMVNVDVPHYVVRYLAQRAENAENLGILAGLVDAAGRRVVTGAWEPWRDELAWMALYFTGGVWVSLALSRFPDFGSPVPLRDAVSAGARFRDLLFRFLGNRNPLAR